MSRPYAILLLFFGLSSVLRATDTTAPSIPTGLSANLHSASGFEVNWKASTDDTGVTGYEVKQDSTILSGVDAATNKTLSGLPEATVYAMSVRARDAAGNWSAWSDPMNMATNFTSGSAGQPGPVQIAAGYSHTLLLANDGTVWSWGYGGSGELGDGTASTSSSPVRAGSLTNVVAIAAGDHHSMALREDGTVWAWGRNAHGQLGDGTTTNRNLPVQVSGLNDVVAIAGGGQHSLAVQENGTLWAWGYNGYGQLGDNSTTNRTSPVNVSSAGGLWGVVAVAAGQEHSLAIKSDGSVWAWGGGWSGQLGNGSTSARNTPVKVSSLSGIVAIDAGIRHSVAVGSNGLVYAWGYNGFRQLGDGTVTDRMTPVIMTGLSNVVEISAGYRHSVMLKTDGTLWVVGSNQKGALGLGSGIEDASVAQQVSTWSDILHLSVGTYDFSMAITAEGRIWGMGYNSSGQLGDGTTTIRYTPVEAAFTAEMYDYDAPSVPENLVVTSMASTVFTLSWDPSTDNKGVTSYEVMQDSSVLGDDAPAHRAISGLTNQTSYAMKVRARDSTGNWSAWSDVLNVTTTTDSSPPTVPDGISIAEHTSSSFELSWEASLDNFGLSGYEVRSNGTVLSGVDAATSKTLSGLTEGTVYAMSVRALDTAGNWSAWSDPVDVATNFSTGSTGLPGPVQIATGDRYTLLLANDGTVWGWGRNYQGQLGNGTSLNSSSPVRAGNLTNVVAIAAGGDHSMALREDGTLWVWGDNYYGELGDGTTTSHNTPIQVNGVSHVVAIAVGNNYSLAVQEDGTAWAWGRNHYGQLGDGSTTNRSSPVPVDGTSGLSNVVSVSVGEEHSLALKGDGTVMAWGRGADGRLGNGSTSDHDTPVMVSALSGIVAIDVGARHSVALGSNGTVYAWGRNNYRQLGDGTANSRITPVSMTGLSDVVQVSAGSTQTLMLKSDGSLWVVGDKSSGVLGVGTGTGYVSVAEEVSALSNVIHLSAGANDFSMVITADGRIWGMGDNYYGQLGDGTTTTRYTPVSAAGLSAYRLDYDAPSVPTNLAVSDMSGTALTLNWDASTDNVAVTSYEVRQGTETLGGTGGLTWNIEGLEGLSSYSFAVRATDSTGHWSAWSAAITVTTLEGILPTIPGNLVMSNLGVSGFTLSWDASSDVTGIETYEIADGDTSMGFASTPTWDANGLTIDTLLRMRVRSQDVTGNWSAWSSELEVHVVDNTAPSAPSEIWLDGLSHDGFTLHWQTSIDDVGVTGYEILRDAVTLATTPSLERSIDSLAANTSYVVKIRARDGAGHWSAWSDPLTVITSAAPLVGIEFPPRVVARGGHSLALTNDGRVWAWGRNGHGQLGNGTSMDSMVPVQVSILSKIVAISAGDNHSIALRRDGTVWVWGSGLEGQMGEGFNPSSSLPLQMPGLVDIVAIAAGGRHNLAVNRNGSVWVWGQNSSGQLGLGTSSTLESVPQQISALSNIVAVSGGYDHSLALATDGSVYAWGGNNYGQLGDGTNTDRLSPVALTGLANVRGLSAGNRFSVALTKGGQAYSWGRNYQGQLGGGNNIDQNVPGLVIGLTNLVEVVAGSTHTIFLQGGGSVWTVGRGYLGVLGDGSYESFNTAQKIHDIAGASTIAAGISNSFAVTDQKGAIWVWGKNLYGSLGDGTTSIRYTPVQLEGFTLAVNDDSPPSVPEGLKASWDETSGLDLSWSASADGSAVSGYEVRAGSTTLSSVNGSTVLLSSLALDSTHDISVRAADTFGQWSAWSTPLTVSTHDALADFGYEAPVQVATGGIHSLLLRNDGTVWATGSNTWGQIGSSSSSNPQPTFIQVGSLTDIIELAAGWSHSVALREDGTVWAWGGNTYGQLGDGSTTDRFSPVQVVGLSDIVGIAAGSLQTFAISGNGSVWAWGYNGIYALGLSNSGASYTSPQLVPGLTNIVKVASGSYHGLALQSNGQLVAWGYNNYGQLGDGSDDNRSSPVAVLNISGVVDIAAGDWFSLAVDGDGVAYGWGSNSDGQLGGTSATEWDEPVAIDGLSEVRQISAGASHSLFVVQGGGLWAMGQGDYGQLGLGSNDDQSEPQLSPISDVIWAAAGSYHSMALTNGGAIYGWGAGYTVGLGNPSNQLTPLAITGLNVWSDDFYAPWVPGHLTATRITTNSLSLDWFYSPDLVGVDLYEVRQGTTSLGTVTTPGYEVGSLSADTTYTFAVRAHDAAGHWSAWSNPFTVQTKDDHPPSTPVGLTLLHLAPLHFLLSWDSSTDNDTVGGYEVELEGQSLGVYASPSRLIEGLLGNTSYDLRVRALDADGNWSAWSATYTVATGNTSPPSVPVPLLVGAYDGSSFVFRWKPSFDDLGVVDYEVKLDGQSLGLVTGTMTSITLTGGDATYHLSLRARDAAGNWSEWSQPWAVTTDSTQTRVDYERAVGVQSSGESQNLFTLALANDGTVWAWGKNNLGLLGMGHSEEIPFPVQIPGLEPIVAIAGGPSHRLALDASGHLWVWGRNYHGQLGDGSTSDQATPIEIESIDHIVAVAVGGAHSVALKSDGTVWTWGFNHYGQLGHGTLGGSENLPQQVAGLSDIISVFAGAYRTLALARNGQVYVWGRNDGKQVGDGTTVNRSTPVLLIGMANAVGISAAPNGGSGHSFSWTSDGRLFGWGKNYQGQLGVGSLGSANNPKDLTQTVELPSIISASAGDSHSLFLDLNGTVYATGDGNAGALGNGSDTDISIPAAVVIPKSVIAVSAGYNVSFAIDIEGRIWAWGQNGSAGSLGIGPSVNNQQFTPVKIPGFSLWRRDDIAPVKPSYLTASEVTGDSLTLTWQPATDNQSVMLYEVFQDGSSIGLGGATSLKVSGLAPATTYSFTVRAIDPLGNWSAHSSSVTATTLDEKAPTVPGGWVATKLTSSGFELSWTESTDAVGVIAYELSEVSPGAASLGSTPGHSRTLNGLTSATSYTFKVRAGDAAGNWSPWSAEFTATTPEATTPSVPANLSALHLSTDGFALTWSPSSDNVAVTGYEIMRDTSSLGAVIGTAANIDSLSPNTTYAMKVRARDAEANWSSWSNAFNVTTIADTDGDGLPDAWESAHGLNPANASDATSDNDSDGLTAWEEYHLGTDPGTASLPDTGNQSELNPHRPTPQ